MGRLTATHRRLQRERRGESFATFEPFFAALGVDRAVIRLAWEYLQSRSLVGDVAFHPEDHLTEVVGLLLPSQRRDQYDMRPTTYTALEEIVHTRTGEYPSAECVSRFHLNTIEDLVLAADALVT
jgi:hypothetical protein